jgi:DNA-directed RNA polymerase subunit RPC12/RpoP
MTAWRSAPAATGYCLHCGHGYDANLVTKDGDPRCPYCRGVTRARSNPDTYRRWRDTNQPALNQETP